MQKYVAILRGINVGGYRKILMNDYDIESLALTFLGKAPDKDKVSSIEEFDFNPDEFKNIGNNAFVYCCGKYSDTKITNQFFENKLKLKATTQNRKTIKKLCEILEK